MKITGTVKEMINAGLIPADSFLAGFEDSLVEVMPSPEDLKTFIENFNAEKKSKEMRNIAYAMDLSDNIIQLGNFLCVEAQLIPAAFLSGVPIDESKIDLDKMLSSLYEDEEEKVMHDDIPDNFFDEPDISIFLVATKE